MQRTMSAGLAAVAFGLCPSAFAAGDIAFSLVHDQSGTRIDVPVASKPRVTIGVDQQSNAPVVHILLGREEAARFCDMTKGAIRQPIKIVVSCRVVSEPMVMEPICGGSLQISGRLSREQLQAVVDDIEKGSVPCERPVR